MSSWLDSAQEVPDSGGPSWLEHAQEVQGTEAPASYSAPESFGHGAVQGATLGFGDEINGAVQALGDKVTGRSPGASLVELYRRNRDMFRREDAAAQQANQKSYMGGNLAGGIAPSLVSGATVGNGASLLAALGRNAALGGTAALGGSNADTATGLARDAAIGAGVGGVLGAGAHGLGQLTGKLAGFAAGRVADIDEGVARKAAATAAEETASARSGAGRAAQDAYKQLEHLRELGRRGALNGEQEATAKALEAELGDKAQANLLPASQRKAAAAAAYIDAMSTEGQRAQDLAAQKLSGAEALAQLKARAVRYGLPAIGGAMAGAAGFGGHGALVGAGSGALMGAGLRPMGQSLLRMMKTPAVQRAAMEALSGASEAAAPALETAGNSAARALEPEVSQAIHPRLLQLLAKRKTDNQTPAWAQADQ